MNYYPEQILENINSILKPINSSFEQMCYKLQIDPIKLSSSIFDGSATMQQLGSIAEYLNMPIEALFSDTLDINMDHTSRAEKEEIKEDRKIFSILILNAVVATEFDTASIEKVCKKCVEYADGLIKVLKEK